VKRALKRTAAALLAALLCGCGAAGTDAGLAFDDQKSEPTALVLALPQSLPQMMETTVQKFCGQVSKQSQGTMTVTLRRCTSQRGIAAAVTGDGCDLALLSTWEMARQEPGLGMTAAPFFWESTDHFLAALNKPENLQLAGKLLDGSMKAQPLGVYCRGGLQVVSTRLLTARYGFSRSRVVLPYGLNSLWPQLFGQVGSGAALQQTALQPLSQVLQDNDAQVLVCDADQALTLENSLGEVYGYGIDAGFSGDWLLLTDKTAETLNDRQLAALREAVASSMASCAELRDANERAAWVDGLSKSEQTGPTLQAQGEICLSQKILPLQTEWNRELLSAYRLSYPFITELPAAAAAASSQSGG